MKQLKENEREDSCAKHTIQNDDAHDGNGKEWLWP